MHIFCSNTVPLPSDIVGLPRLSHLILLCNATLPDGIGSMKSLCTVQGLDLLDIKDLGELTNLRDLVISKVTVLTDSNIDALITSLGKLHDLRYLSISFWYNDENDYLSSLLHPPLNLKRLYLGTWTSPTVPRWINGDLKNLQTLHLSVRKMPTNQVCILGELPSLVNFTLQFRHCPDGSASIVFKAPGFPALDHFEILCIGDDNMSPLHFEAGVMPNLQTLDIAYKGTEWSSTPLVGMEHLLNLREIHVSSFPNMMDDCTRRALAEAIQLHRNHPALELFPDSKIKLCCYISPLNCLPSMLECITSALCTDWGDPTLLAGRVKNWSSTVADWQFELGGDSYNFKV
jgi:hypothetical protein